jgi:hypothetical protein
MKEFDELDLGAGADDTGDEDDPYAMWLVVVRALRNVFPYIDVEEINRYNPWSDEIDDLHASQFARLIDSVAEHTGIAIPECDYPLVGTLDDLERYLTSRVLSKTA